MSFKNSLQKSWTLEFIIPCYTNTSVYKPVSVTKFNSAFFAIRCIIVNFEFPDNIITFPMKKTLLFIFLIVGFTCHKLQAQQPWRFHIAFEDGTGARDTLWMIFDNKATVEGVDYQLGEGTPKYEPGKFNVFMYNRNVDSTKVKAYPYSQFPNMSTDEVFAINYTYPVIIRWDSSLFNAPYLPNNPPGNPHMNVAIVDGDYQFFVLGFDPTSPYSHTINMLTKDSLLCPESQGIPLFGLGTIVFVFFNDPTLNIYENAQNGIKIFPNPSKQIINLMSNESINSYSIYSSVGRVIFSKQFSSPKLLNKYTIPFDNFDSGIYLIKLVNSNNQEHYEKFIIQK